MAHVAGQLSGMLVRAFAQKRARLPGGERCVRPPCTGSQTAIRHAVLRPMHTIGSPVLTCGWYAASSCVAAAAGGAPSMW